MNNPLKKYLLLIFILGLLPQYVFAQLDDNYFVADQLLRQQKFEQASKKFYKLHQENPRTYVLLEKLTECLINLKEYDRAVSITRQAIEKGYYRAEAQIRLGEIYHISGNTEQAFKTWNQVLERNSGSQQIYLKVARALSDRRAYEQAIEVYEKTSELAPSSSIIDSELAEVYLQAGKYEKAIQKYLQLVKQNPERMNFVQRRLIRFQDDNIYDVAILEIGDFLDELPDTHPSTRNLQQLEVWLLMERKLYKRALATAKHYEAESSSLTYTLYNIGSKLLAEQQFELAEQAYSYYIDNQIASLKNRCKEELATVYTEWAKYLENYNLGLSTKRGELYQKASETLESLHQEVPNYQRMDQILVSLSELSLDVFHEPKKASQYLEELKTLSGNSTKQAQENYIEGRLHLYNKEYTRARIAFTKSNKQEHIGSLAEKSRYYLALTDFYSGDYEFAKIQLNSLERQNTSYFANDAVQLRLWIQNGLQADSTGARLKPFAKAIEHFSQGQDQLGINELTTLFEKDRYNPLLDEALLELSTYQDTENAVFVYEALSTYLAQHGQSSPLYERLWWEKARLADQFVTNKEIAISLPRSASGDTLSAEERFFKGKQGSNQISIPANVEQLIPMYEKILMNFPNGFYASYARDRIQELQKLQT